MQNVEIGRVVVIASTYGQLAKEKKPYKLVRLVVDDGRSPPSAQTRSWALHAFQLNVMHPRSRASRDRPWEASIRKIK